MINQIATDKAIALMSEKIQKVVHKSITSQNYTCIFTSLEINLSKKFKANIFDIFCFTQCLSLLVVQKI